MSDEPEPAEHGDSAPPQEATPVSNRETPLLRRTELLAKVREVNKQSLTGPDSPTIHLYRSDTC